MKKIIIAAFACVIAAIFISCNNQKPTYMETTDQNTAIFAQGGRGPAEWFTGTTWVEPLVNPDETEGLYSVGQVTFEPGGRTLWHTHPAGQILLVTEGKGFYQERGKEARPIAKGDVVVIPKDVEHWHGAAKDSKFVHIAISNMKDGSNVTWLAPVTEEEYNIIQTE